MPPDRRRPAARAALLIAALAVPSLLGLKHLRAERDEPPKAGGTTVPFEMLPSNHMVVRAKLNGKGPFRLVFDLGSPVTLLAGKAAEQSGAIPEDAPRSFLFGVRGEGKLESLALGELTAKDVPVVVMDHPALKALGGILGKPLDGILGYTFFARYRTTLDYQAKTLTFEPVDFEVRDLFKDLQAKMIGPKVAKSRVLAGRSLWGLSVGEPAGGPAARGVPVTAVHPGSPAAAAGLKPGDVLVSIDGRWTANVSDAYAAAAVEPGRAVPIVILREDQEQTLTVTPKDGI
jgi:membrane-associated protease RseP (regulator of RpoE activity)